MFRYKLAHKINKVFFYGWLIVFVSALATFFSSPGQTYSISAFINSYIEEFGYSRTLISTIYSVATIISGSLLVFVGKAVDRFGQRTMLMVVGSMLAVACFFNSFIVNLPMIFIGFFMLRYFGQGSLTLIPGSLVPQWFDKHKALALSLLTMGTIFGNLIAPRLNVFMIGSMGWQGAWRIWSLSLIILFLPIVYIFVVNKPEDIKLLPDNTPVKSDQDIEDEMAEVERTSFTLSGALRTKEFWLVGVISMIAPMISTGMMFHFYSIMSEKGFADEQAAIVIGFVALPGFIMPIIAGIIIDRYRSRLILSFTLSMIVLDLIFFTFVDSLVMAGAFMLIYGFFTNIYGVTLNVIWVKYFGRLHLGAIRGAATVFVVIGSAFGTVPFGLSYDLTGSYVRAFQLMALLTLLSVFFSLFIRKPKRKI